MARKIRFALDMGDGFEINDIDALREHFNLEKVLEYLKEEKFITWLRDRYYETEAASIEALDASDEKNHEKICRILNVGWNVDYDDFDSFQKRLSKIRQYTDDLKIISNLHLIAFDQFELYDRLDQNYETIYLCGETFTIPVSKENITYIGINNPDVKIDTADGLIPEGKNIKLQNVKFDIVKAAEYGNSDAQYQLGLRCENEEKFEEAFSWFLKSAEQGNSDSMIKVSEFYLKGAGTKKDESLALEWCIKATSESPSAYVINGDILVDKNDNEGALKCYQSALDSGCSEAIDKIIVLAEKGFSPAQLFVVEKMIFSQDEQNHRKGIELFEKSVINGNYKLLKVVERRLEDSQSNENAADIELYGAIAKMYYNGTGVEKDTDSAIKWYSMIAEEDPDDREAKKVITRFANENHGLAQYTYCRKYASDSEKVNWMRKSAENGYDEAQYTMGLLYMTGNEVPKSNSEALKWFKMAAAQGHSSSEMKVRDQQYWYK